MDARAVHHVDPDLVAPSQLHRGAAHIARIAETLETSLLAPEERTAKLLIEPLLAPLMEMVTRVAGAMDMELGCVFIVNCFAVLRDALLPFALAAPYVQQLADAIDKANSSISDGMRQQRVVAK